MSKSYIKSLYINGFKKFLNFNVEFNKNLNILVGENEAGKSTILEAIKLVIFQSYKNTDKSVLLNLFNINDVIKYQENPSLETLPKILIELELDVDGSHPRSQDLFGQHNHKKKELFGLRFICEFSDELSDGRLGFNSTIPVDYYVLKWETFSGRSYVYQNNLLKTVSIDTSKNDTNSSYNYYNKQIFNNIFDSNERNKNRHFFRESLNNIFSGDNSLLIDDNRVFNINESKLILENLITIYDNNIPLESKGSGMENIIKTEIALAKAGETIELILLEEPENHLSHSNLRSMINRIKNHCEDSQIILTTHSNLITSRLGLNNILWIGTTQSKSFNNLDKNTVQFFHKSDDNKLLEFLLSNKVILVEGKTEYLLLALLYEQCYKTSLDEDNITIISLNGLSYKNYLDLMRDNEKKVAVITDNDVKQKKIDKAKTANDSSPNINFFMGKTINDWTWEVCFYNINSKALDEIINIDKDAEYPVKEYSDGRSKNLPIVLRKMINCKSESAYSILTSDRVFNIPDYIEEAFEWIRS